MHCALSIAIGKASAEGFAVRRTPMLHFAQSMLRFALDREVTHDDLRAAHRDGAQCAGS